MKDYGGKNRHKKLRRKIKGYGEKSKGADRVKGGNKMHEGEKTCQGKMTDYWGK